MRIVRSVRIVLGLPFLLAGGLAAAQEMTGEDTVSQAQSMPGDAVIEEQGAQDLLADDIIGRTVYSTADQGGTIGTVDSLLFNQSGEIVGAVVSTGGILGFGGKRVGLSWDAFEVRPDDAGAYVDLTEEQIENAPDFKDRAALEAERAQEERIQNVQQQPATGGGTAQ